MLVLSGLLVARLSMETGAVDLARFCPPRGAASIACDGGLRYDVTLSTGAFLSEPVGPLPPFSPGCTMQ
jgi:hypothetical protein